MSDRNEVVMKNAILAKAWMDSWSVDGMQKQKPYIYQDAWVLDKMSEWSVPPSDFASDFIVNSIFVKNNEWIPLDENKVVFKTRCATSKCDEHEKNVNLERVKSRFRDNVVRLIKNEDFEYGIESKVDVYLMDCIGRYKSYVKVWINELFVSFYDDSEILLGIIRAISRMSYEDIAPEGPTMITASLPHRNLEVRECAVRALENWGNRECLNMLESVRVSPVWLQEYVDTVIDDLKREGNACLR